MPQAAERNPQTVAFLKMLGLPYDLDPAGAAAAAAGPIAGLLLTLKYRALALMAYAWFCG